MMKKLLLIVISVMLFSCKTREKTLQKTETQSEKKSDATYKIEDKTFKIVSDKELSIFDKSNFAQNNESSKTETKNVEIIKEYYENGTLKKEIQRNFSELAETTKNAITELEEKISTEKETSQYWEDSSISIRGSQTGCAIESESDHRISRVRSIGIVILEVSQIPLSIIVVS